MDNIISNETIITFRQMLAETGRVGRYTEHEIRNMEKQYGNARCITVQIPTKQYVDENNLDEDDKTNEFMLEHQHEFIVLVINGDNHKRAAFKLKGVNDYLFTLQVNPEAVFSNLLFRNGKLCDDDCIFLLTALAMRNIKIENGRTAAIVRRGDKVDVYDQPTKPYVDQLKARGW